ncbi:Hpt domain-containing protein [Sagittula salina]|uniref:Hpt domain-containing protein n=1 Tax=Sagittula salina TaxID=2820268 RepID=A0A940MPX4_9RHOB|nr:Hpt domain-containing protein [Sagittula salina]MBP0483294.1 Hpt domain-containing protein [Sagittula salina]
MIDWARVGELVDEIGAEDFEEVVELFLLEVDGAISALEAAAGNAVIVEEQMHFLKGAALNLGFEALAQLCLKGEKAAASGRADVVGLDEVRQIYRSSRLQFERDLPDRLAA